MTILSRSASPENRLVAVIGGGANLGPWAAGVFDPMNEAEIPICGFGGASVGSMFASWWAKHWGDKGAGERLLPICMEFARGRPPLSYLGLAKRLERALVREFGRDNLEDYRSQGGMPVEVVLSCRNTAARRTEFLSKGPVIDGVMASAAWPGVFPVRRISGVRYGDGAVANYAGIETASHFSLPFNQVIVVDMSNRISHRWEQSGHGRDIVDLLTAAMYRNAQLQMELFKLQHPEIRVLHLRPTLPAIRFGDFSFTEVLFRDGQEFGRFVVRNYFDLQGQLRETVTLEEPVGNRVLHGIVEEEMKRRQNRKSWSISAFRMRAAKASGEG